MVKWGGCKDHRTISDLLEVFKADQMKCLQGDLLPEGRGKSQGPEFEVDGFSCCSSVQPALGEMLHGWEPHLSWHSTLLLHWSVWPTSNLRVCERHFFPISLCLIHPQHLSPHQRGQRQQSQHYPKQLAEPATGLCHLLAVMKTGQIKNMFPLPSFTWKIISSQLTSKKWPGKGSRNEIWWQIDKYGQLSLWWSSSWMDIFNTQYQDFLCSDT